MYHCVDCDAGVRKLAKALGWIDELESLWRESTPALAQKAEGQEVASKSKDDRLNGEIANLTEEIDKSLRISNAHTTSLQEHLKWKSENVENAPDVSNDDKTLRASAPLKQDHPEVLGAISKPSPTDVLGENANDADRAASQKAVNDANKSSL